MVAKGIYQCRQFVSRRALADTYLAIMKRRSRLFWRWYVGKFNIWDCSNEGGRQDFFLRIQIWGPTLFFKSEKWGLGLFLRLKKWGLGLFLRLKKWGQILFWTCEIGGLVVFLDREIPQNPAWVPGKFWTVPYWTAGIQKRLSSAHWYWFGKNPAAPLLNCSNF